jgi:hypothetical protein
VGLTGPNLEGGISQRGGAVITDPRLEAAGTSSASASASASASDGKQKGVKKKGFSYDEIPWGEIFSNPVSLTLFFNMFTYGWIGYMVLTELPSYLTDVLGACS